MLEKTRTTRQICTIRHGITSPDMCPRGEGSQLGKIGSKREENKDKPKSNHLISVKCPHRLTQEVQRRSPTEDGPIQGDWWCSRTSHPYLVCSGPNFVGCLLLPLQRRLHAYFRWIGMEGWWFAQDRKACKEAQLHSISTIDLMMVWTKGHAEEAHGSLTWRIEWPPFLLSTYKRRPPPPHLRHQHNTKGRHDVARRGKSSIHILVL